MTSHYAAKNVSSVADSIVAQLMPNESPSPSSSSSGRRLGQQNNSDKVNLKNKRFVNPYKKRASKSDVIPEGGSTDNLPKKKESEIITATDEIDFSSYHTNLSNNMSGVDLDTLDIDSINLEDLNLGSININLSQFTQSSADTINNTNENSNEKNNENNVNNNNNNNGNENNDSLNGNINSHGISHEHHDSLKPLWEHPEVLKNFEEIQKEHDTAFEQAKAMEKEKEKEKEKEMEKEMLKQKENNKVPGAAPPAAAPLAAAPVAAVAAPAAPAAPVAPAPSAAVVAPLAEVAGARITTITAESAQNAGKVSNFAGFSTKDMTKLTDEQQKVLQEKQLVSTFDGLKSISTMTRSELEAHKDEILSRKLVSGSDYAKLVDTSDERQMNRINNSIDTKLELTDEEKARIAEIKSKFGDNSGNNSSNIFVNGTPIRDEYVRPENYDLKADIAHSKEEEMANREKHKQELENAAKVSSFQGLQSTSRDVKNSGDDEHKEMAASQAKVTNFAGLQSSNRNVTTVDEKEKDELLKSKLVSQTKDQFLKQANAQNLKKANSKVSVDTDAVGKALASSKNIWQEMEKQTMKSSVSSSDVTNGISSPKKSKPKRKTMIQQQSATPSTMDIVAEDDASK